MLDAILMAVGLSGLFVGGDMFVGAAARLARSFGISTLIIGLTIVAIGTSMPELIVSVGAALGGTSDIAIGNVIGSNISNVGLIIGVGAILAPFAVQMRLLRREIPLMILITVAAYLLFTDGMLSRFDGALLMLGAAAYLGWMVFSARQENHTTSTAPSPDIRRGREALRLIIGLLVLLVGARLTVDGAIVLARSAGISELVIGMTLVAIGTSLPELVTCVVAARHNETDMVLGNVVGSNIANLLIILGTTAFIHPTPVDEHVINFDALIMIGFALLLVPFAFNRHISRLEGAAFIAAYIAYMLFIFFVRNI